MTHQQPEPRTGYTILKPEFQATQSTSDSLCLKLYFLSKSSPRSLILSSRLWWCIQWLQFNFLWIGGHSANSSHGLAHPDDNAVFADYSFSLMGVYVTSCLKRMPTTPQWRSWSTPWVFKMALPSTMKANTRLQRELPQDLILMDLTSLCSEYKIQSFRSLQNASSLVCTQLKNNLELKLYVTKQFSSQRPDHRESMTVNNNLLDILFKGAEILLSCWEQSKNLWCN